MSPLLGAGVTTIGWRVGSSAELSQFQMTNVAPGTKSPPGASDPRVNVLTVFSLPGVGMIPLQFSVLFVNVTPPGGTMSANAAAAVANRRTHTVRTTVSTRVRWDTLCDPRRNMPRRGEEALRSRIYFPPRK